MFGTLLIANRGEIARRIQRTARRLGVRTIAIYSEADRAMPFVREADEAVCIGAAPARESYLAQDKLLEAARRTGAQAIHPGYGFLSENADFAEAAQAAGLIWVGAPPSAIRVMGRKDAAKKRMIEAGVPVTPGYLGADQNIKRLEAEATAIGYPVLVKAVAGGGGKGMRKVENAAVFQDALQSCQREAQAAFGDDRVLIEKYVEAPRHIEVQVFGDTQGHIVHLFERDCSLQRRHQKVIEEAPAPGIDEETREAICTAAVKAARAVNYVGAGTIEFIADASEGVRADRIWFMEMNTRLQVEHPITEAITGLDLVEWQMRIASGESLPLRQDQIRMNGWAMEARLYAENPISGFLPSTGKLKHFVLPSTVRVDSGFDEGDAISPHYDPLLAKIVAHAPSRAAATRALTEACGAIEVWPVKTNAALLARIARHPEFIAGHIDTGFITRHGDQLIADAAPSPAILQSLARALLPADANDPWCALSGFRIAAPPETRIVVEVEGTSYIVALDGTPSSAHVIGCNGERIAFAGGQVWRFASPVAEHAAGHGPGGDGVIAAPMPGRVLFVAVKKGDRVALGQQLLVLEAMKMEHSLVAPFAGVVADLYVETGAQVCDGTPLVRIEGVQ